MLRATSVVTLTMALAGTPCMAGNQSRSEAFALPGGQFEVIAAFSENAIYWCGAATYAASSKLVAGTGRIYVLSGPGPSAARPGRMSVRFGIEPPPGAAQVSSMTTSVDIVGNSLTLAEARQTCNERNASG